MSSSNESRGGEVVVYEAPDGEVRVDVRLERETVWLSLNQMAELFGRDKSVISRHLGNVFSSGELEREAVVAKHATTAADGKTYQVDYFNLDASRSTPAYRRGPRICSTSSSRTTPSATATNASARCSFSTTCGATVYCCARTAVRCLRTTPWWHWRYSSQRAPRRRRT